MGAIIEFPADAASRRLGSSTGAAQREGMGTILILPVVRIERDADGGELHGYVRSPTAGWTDYYRDLMSGTVLEGGKRLGIPADAWMA